MAITSPQNTSDYESKATQASASGEVGTSVQEYNAGGGYNQQTLHDHFVTTEKKLSGLYAGSDGLGVDVSGDTTLKAGVISSTADASKNSLTTKHLDAQSEENSSVWKIVSAGGQGSIGSGMLSNAAKEAKQLGEGMAADTLGMLGGGRSHNEHSTSYSAIGGNITVHAASQSGSYLTDVSKANGALENKFDPQKLQNEMQSAQVGMQLVGESLGSMSQALSDAGVPGFSQTDLKDSWARTLLEAGGSAGIAALTGGNAGAAALSTVLGDVAATASREAVGELATSIMGAQDSHAKRLLSNAFSGVIASGAGAVGGLAAGGGNAGISALNGAAAASALEQYNAEEHMRVVGKKADRTSEILDMATDNALAVMAATPGPWGSAASFALGTRLMMKGDYGMGALAIIFGVPDIIGVDTSAISSGVILARNMYRSMSAADREAAIRSEQALTKKLDAGGEETAAQTPSSTDDHVTEGSGRGQSSLPKEGDNSDEADQSLGGDPRKIPVDRLLEGTSEENLKGFAEGKIGDTILRDVNQRARNPEGLDEDAETALFDIVQEKIAKSGKPKPNGTAGSAHAEISLLQQALDKGIADGAHLDMTVYGRPICSFCLSDVPKMADRVGLSSMRIRSFSRKDRIDYEVFHDWKPGTKLEENKLMKTILGPSKDK